MMRKPAEQRSITDAVAAEDTGRRDGRRATNPFHRIFWKPRRASCASPWLFTNHPMGNPPAPEGYTWSLGLLYVVWAVAIVLLYFPCRWFADLKARRKDRWLNYL